MASSVNQNYSIRYSKKVGKEISALPKNTYKKIIAAILNLQLEPFPVNCKKLKSQGNYYRIRVGDYRIVYTVENQILTITIIKIGHRSDVYEFLS
jgi:mRNA interferase RelE/StbE